MFISIFVNPGLEMLIKAIDIMIAGFGWVR